MRTNLPVQFDRIITITYQDGTTEQSGCFPGERGLIYCTFPKTNGYDANNHRVTNLVGCDGSQLLKRCPACGLDKSPLDYGEQGRITTWQRDQSQCLTCRARY